MNDQAYFWNVYKVDAVVLKVCDEHGQSSKIRSLHIFAISPEKYGG